MVLCALRRAFSNRNDVGNGRNFINSEPELIAIGARKFYCTATTGMWWGQSNRGKAMKVRYAGCFRCMISSPLWVTETDRRWQTRRGRDFVCRTYQKKKKCECEAYASPAARPAKVTSAPYFLPKVDECVEEGA